MVFTIHLPRYRPLKLDKRSEVAKHIKSKFFEDQDLVKTNHLINLESHSMPVFLFKQVIPIIKKELLFKKRISQLANKFFQKIIRAEGLKKLIFSILSNVNFIIVGIAFNFQI